MRNVNEMIEMRMKTTNDKSVGDLRRKFSAQFCGDRLRIAVTAIVSFCLWSACANAEFDFALGGTSRSYPLAGVIEAESGYGILLRGTGRDPLSSYLRARIDGSSAYTFNSLGAALEFFPLAVLGARAGGEAIQNDKDYTAYDCETYRCLGRYYRTYIEGELTLGAGSIFVQGRWRRERWTQKDSATGDFIDPTSGIYIDGAGDSQTVYFGVLGWKLDEHWQVLGVLRYAESDMHGGWSRTPYGVVRYTNGNFSIGAGAGQFESSLKSKDFTAVGVFRWEISPGLSVE